MTLPHDKLGVLKHIGTYLYGVQRQGLDFTPCYTSRSPLKTNSKSTQRLDNDRWPHVHILPNPHTFPLAHICYDTRHPVLSLIPPAIRTASKHSQNSHHTPEDANTQARVVIFSDAAGPSTALALATDAPRVQRAIGETRHCPHTAQSLIRDAVCVWSVWSAWSVQCVQERFAPCMVGYRGCVQRLCSRT